MTKLKHKDARKLIKKNEFREIVEKIIDYSRRKTENVIIIIVAVVVAAVAVPMFINSAKEKEIKAAQMLARADMIVTRPVIDSSEASRYGMFSSKEEKYESALETYMQIIQTYERTKTAAIAYLGAADAYYNKESYSEALEYYNLFLEKFPKHNLNQEGLSGRGYVYAQQGNYEAAAGDWEKMDESAITYYDTRIRLAEIYKEKGNEEKFKELLKNTAEKRPGTYWAGLAQEKIKRDN
ncbi:MAG: tetratricopeptide repeat protein [Candidatus Goldiibacteriota bacterium]